MRLAIRALAGATVLLVAFALLAPFGMRPNPRLPLAATPADQGIRYESVAFSPPDRPITLRAWWMPAEPPRGAVVLVHGGGEDNRSQPHQDGIALARDLVQHGFAVLAPDLRNYGESDATPERATFGDLEAWDVVGALDFLAKQAPGVPIAGIGCSMGGATVIRAAERDERLQAIVADSTFADAWHVAPNFVAASTGLPRAAIPLLLWSAAYVHGFPLDRGQTIEAARRLSHRPALLIHNEADPIAPVEETRALSAAIAGSEIWITPAPPEDHPLRRAQGPWGMHCQSYKLDPAGYADRVTRFLDGALPPAPS
jgi:uncharacterized protein